MCLVICAGTEWDAWNWDFFGEGADINSDKTNDDYMIYHSKIWTFFQQQE